MLEIAFRPDRQRREPLPVQLERHLRELVEVGKLRSGEKLPASRELAGLLSVSRNTVDRAYRALIDDGVLSAHVGQGTFVASRPRAAAMPEHSTDVEAEPPPAFAWEGLVAQRFRDQRLPGVVRPADPKKLRFDFTGGRVESRSLPVSLLRKVYSQTVGDHLRSIANHLDPLGWPPLREEIAQALVARGIRCTPDEIGIVNGAQQALDLVARVLIDPGDAVGIEEPGYFGAHLAFRAAGAHGVPIRVDEEGLVTRDLAKSLRSRRLKLIYTTPAAQMPTGAVLSERRRRELLDLAYESQTPIVEDDFDAEFRAEGPPLPALKTDDRDGRVVYVGTFSKALYPSLRVGYVVAAPPLLGRLAATRFACDLATDAVAQAVLAELIHTGALERHIRRMRRLHAQRRRALLEALDDLMPGDASWSRPRGGQTAWLTLDPTVDPNALALAAIERGLSYLPGNALSLTGHQRNSLALCFVHLSPKRLREGVGELADAIRAARN